MSQTIPHYDFVIKVEEGNLGQRFSRRTHVSPLRQLEGFKGENKMFLFRQSSVGLNARDSFVLRKANGMSTYRAESNYS